MTVIFALLGCLGEVSLLYGVTILLRLSKKLGEVTKMRPYYRGYYVAIVCLVISSAVRFIQASLLDSFTAGNPFPLANAWDILTIIHHISLAVGLTAACLVAFLYWGWLFKERFV
ncbi:MAG: hypothetical protein ACUVWB_01475 [Anaerolineae bacterium]